MYEITEEDIARADAEASDAEQARLAAETAYGRGTAQPHLYRQFEQATLAATHALAHASSLRRERAHQQAAAEFRARAEKDASKENRRNAERLAASRDGAAKAVADAQAAIRKALDSVTQHNGLVQEAAAVLTTHGLGLDGDGDHATGARRDGSLRLSGEDWYPVDAASLLDSVLRSVVHETNPRHPLGRTMHLTYGGPSFARAREQLLPKGGAK